MQDKEFFRNEIKKIRSTKGQKAHVILFAIGNIMFQGLKEFGDFYLDDENLYYLLKEENKLIFFPTKRKDLNFQTERIFLDLFRFSTEENSFTKIYQQVYMMAYSSAVKTKIHTFSYYSEEKKKLFLSDNKGWMYVLDGSEILYYRNGHDGVVFKETGFDPIDPDFSRSKDRYLFTGLFTDQIWFYTQDKKELQRQRDRFMEWFYSLFFGSIINERPLIVMNGNAGSGKTSTIGVVGYLLQGQAFRPITLSNKRDDFVNSLYNEFLFLIDNLDENPPSWFMDIVASVTTGGSISVRELFKSVNTQSIKFSPDVNIAVTTRTPKFNRDDIATRAMIFHLKQPSDLADKTLIELARAYKNLFWGIILEQLNKRVLELSKDKSNYPTRFRMNSFVNFSVRSTQDERKGYIKYLFNLLGEQQQQFNLFNNPDFELLYDFVKSGDYIKKDKTNNKLKDQTWTATDLFKYFQLNTATRGIYKNPTDIGKAISNIEDFLKKRIKMKKSLSRGRTVYRFGGIIK